MAKTNSDYNPYEELGNAIVIQAANDYERELARFIRARRRGNRKMEEDAKTEIKFLEKFFRSDWYKMLTEVDSEYMIRNLRKKVCDNMCYKGEISL